MKYKSTLLLLVVCIYLTMAFIGTDQTKKQIPSEIHISSLNVSCCIVKCRTVSCKIVLCWVLLHYVAYYVVLNSG